MLMTCHVMLLQCQERDMHIIGTQMNSSSRSDLVTCLSVKPEQLLCMHVQHTRCRSRHHSSHPAPVQLVPAARLNLAANAPSMSCTPGSKAILPCSLTMSTGSAAGSEVKAGSRCRKLLTRCWFSSTWTLQVEYTSRPPGLTRAVAASSRLSCGSQHRSDTAAGITCSRAT